MVGFTIDFCITAKVLNIDFHVKDISAPLFLPATLESSPGRGRIRETQPRRGFESPRGGQPPTSARAALAGRGDVGGVPRPTDSRYAL